MIEGFAIFAAVVATIAFVVTHLKLKAAERTFQKETGAHADRFEREINEAHEDRDRLLNGLGDCFLLLDSNGTIHFANSEACQLFQHRDLVSRPIREVLLEPRLLDFLLHCLKSGEPVQSRVVLPQQASPLGEQETRGFNAWHIDAARLSTPADSAPLTRVIIRDVTASYQTEQIRKDFVANASHELRTPMAIINGYLENLLDDGMMNEPEVARRFLSVMRKHADRISRIVEDMLMISKLESGEASTLNVEPFRIRSCINDVLERLEAVIRDRNAEIFVMLPDDKLNLLGDRYYWTQILFNLVENALKQNPHPGLKIHIGCETTGDHYRIWVSDNGIGIPSAALPHIFRRFYRVEKHHSQNEVKGTGLGLSIVKRAIEAHGGTITVSSVPGRETKFLMTVPNFPPQVESNESVIS